ncbi:MAG TPA: hypothetical protein VJY85_02130 [Candidatus Limnocylindria bacterium]|nr:hypothetical protein [Candidatus Limnocylindria bacterium]
MTTPRLATGFLLGAGLLLTAAGLVGIALGIFFAPWLYDQLPPVLIDTAAVGGAATALGVLLLGLAAAHVAAALGVIRGVAMLSTPAVVLCLAMAVLSGAWAVAALVSAAAGTGIPVAMLPASLALGLVTAAYGWAARRLISLRRSPSGTD